MRRIVVLYQVDDSVRVAVFTCAYEQVGDYSLSWRDHALVLRMRDGRDESGNRVYVQVFVKAWEAVVCDNQEI